MLANTLHQTADGIALQAQLEQGNSLRADIHRTVDRAFIAFVHALLSRYSKNPGKDPATGVRAVLILQRIIPYLESAAPESGRSAGSVENFEQQVASLLWSTRFLATGDVPGERPRADSDRRHVGRRTDDPPSPDSGRITEIQFGLRHSLERALSGAADSAAHLRTAQYALRQADSPAEVAVLRKILLDCADELVGDLDRVAEDLRLAEDGAREMRSLTGPFENTITAHQDPELTDALTGIPNRAALLHRLRAEAGRAQRHSIPLALAIIDPDRLDEAGSYAGPAAAAKVVCCYAREILASFRGYDMVARWGEDGEFAVLLPNTGHEQAVSALRKAHHRVSAASFRHRGRLLSVPTFSSGLAWYLPGECPEDLLQRAAQALRRAKSTGINRIETSLPDTA